MDIDKQGKLIAYSMGYNWNKGRTGVMNNQHIHLQVAPFPN